MTKLELGERLKQFAIGVGKLVLSLQYNVINKNYVGQLVRCSSSSAANYRAALRGKLTADFTNKLKIVEEELDESLFFLALVKEFNNIFSERIMILHAECNELLSIIVASLNTIRRNSSEKS